MLEPIGGRVKQTYLDPNIQSLQKRVEGGRLEPTYLDPIRNSLQKPKGGRSVMAEKALKSMLKSKKTSKVL
jgi:hypothetical protein